MLQYFAAPLNGHHVTEYRNVFLDLGRIKDSVKQLSKLLVPYRDRPLLISDHMRSQKDEAKCRHVINNSAVATAPQRKTKNVCKHIFCSCCGMPQKMQKLAV